MSIENRNLKAGTKLVARFKGKDYEAEVVRTKDGLRYRLAGGKEFKSPSSAGSAIMGGNACNGWRFWSLAGSEPSPLAKSVTKTQPRPAKKKPSKTSKEKPANAKTPTTPSPKPTTNPAEPAAKPEALQKLEAVVGDPLRPPAENNKPEVKS